MVTAKDLQDVIEQVNASYALMVERIEKLEAAKKPVVKEKTNKA